MIWFQLISWPSPECSHYNASGSCSISLTKLSNISQDLKIDFIGSLFIKLSQHRKYHVNFWLKHKIEKLTPQTVLQDFHHTWHSLCLYYETFGWVGLCYDLIITAVLSRDVYTQLNFVWMDAQHLPCLMASWYWQ